MSDLVYEEVRIKGGTTNEYLVELEKKFKIEKVLKKDLYCKECSHSRIGL